jgi:hypothetical protein
LDPERAEATPAPSPGHRDATSAIAVLALEFLILYGLLTHSDEFTR